MSLISRYFKKVAPGKGTMVRQAMAQGIKAARARQKTGAGPNVRKTLISKIKSETTGRREAASKALRLRKASHKITVSPGVKLKKTPKFAKAKVTMVGAGGRVRSSRKAAMLKTKSYIA